MNEGILLEMDADYIKRIVDTAVTSTLRNLGLISGWLSTNECRKLFGTDFDRMVEGGAIRPIIRGNKKMYSREQIEAALVVQHRRAQLQIRRITKTLAKK